MNELAESTSHAIDRIIALTPLMEAMAASGDYHNIQESFLNDREKVLGAIPEIDNYRTANRLDYVISKSISTEGSTIEHVLRLVDIGTALSDVDGEIHDYAYENGLWTVELGIGVLAAVEEIGLSEDDVSQVIDECIDAMNDISLISMTKSSRLNTLTRNSISVHIGKKMIHSLRNYYSPEAGLAKAFAKFNESNKVFKELILKVHNLE